MDFKDFSPKDLIGKLVHIEGRNNEAIDIIVKASKASFSVKKSSKSYTFIGTEKGGDRWSFTTAKLITEQEAQTLRTAWRQIRECREMREQIIKSLPTATHETLSALIAELNKTQS